MGIDRGGTVRRESALKVGRQGCTPYTYLPTQVLVPKVGTLQIRSTYFVDRFHVGSVDDVCI
jgi:hypothetical protein